MILSVVVNDWRISIPITLLLWYQSVVVLFDGRHLRFWNVNSAIPIDVELGRSLISIASSTLPM